MQHRQRKFITENFRGRSRNTITELKDKEHKEHSVTEKVKHYFNIYECGRNVLDRLDITYQRSFMANPKYK